MSCQSQTGWGQGNAQSSGEKWTGAGREVAWEVWGWSEKTGQGCTSSETKRNWGWDIAPNRVGDFEEADTVDRVKARTKNRGDKTLAIAPETLRWDEEEENFETT